MRRWWKVLFAGAGGGTAAILAAAGMGGTAPAFADPAVRGFVGIAQRFSETLKAGGFRQNTSLFLNARNERSMNYYFFGFQEGHF